MPSPGRRRRRSLAGPIPTVLVLAMLVLTAGCAGQDDRPRVAAGPTTPPTGVPADLTCPGGERVGTAGGLYSEIPDGDDTREQAVAGWLEAHRQPGEPYVFSADGTKAWVLREDGTARARIDLVEHHGFLAQGYDECTGTGVDITPVYPVGRENPWRPRALVLADERAGLRTLLYRGVLVTIPDDWTRVGPGCGSGDESWVPPGQKFCLTDRGIRFHPAGTFQPVDGFGARRTPGADPEWSGFAEAGDVEVYVGDDERGVVDRVLGSLRVRR